MTPTRRRSVIVGLALGALLTVGGVVACGSKGGKLDATLTTPGASPEPTSKIPTAPNVSGKKLPKLTLEMWDGSKVALRDLPTKPLVLNVWASTCAPCVKEMPAFESVHQKLGDNVRFVGINNQDRKNDADDMAKKTGVTYELVRDPDGELFTALGLVGMPSTIMVKPDGSIVYLKTGELSADKLTSLINEKLLS